MFGMRCRKTELMIVYSIMDKSAKNIIPLIKKHTSRGSLIFSDSHMSYVNITDGTSRLTTHGFYHMWTNHSHRMVHEKFPFNTTLHVERGWSEIKRDCYPIRKAQKYSRIQ